MEEFSQEEKDKIISALKAKEAMKPCPRCGNTTFSLIDGYFSHFIQPRLGGISIGGPSVPAAVVVCTNCGWLSEHALGVLGLLTGKNEDASEEKK